MNFFNQRRYKFISLFLITLLASAIAWALNVQRARPEVIKSQPPPNSRNIDSFAPLTLTFDQEVAVAGVTITSDPSEDWQLEQMLSDVIVAKSQEPLTPAKLYTVTVNWKGSEVYSFSFTTIGSQSDPKLLQEIQKEVERDYPLAQFTPHNTPLYRVVYTSPMTLEIIIKNSNISSQEAVNEIKDWVRSVGGNVEAHKYVVALPSPAPTRSSTD